MPATHLANQQLTVLIAAAREGDRKASDQLFALVYKELRAIAKRSRFVGKHGQTLQPTALANEAYLMFQKRFPVPPKAQREDRHTFFFTVAMAMRTILRDYWRKKRVKPKLQLEDWDFVDRRDDGDVDSLDYLALDGALDKLEKYNSRWFDVVMHRYFAGRTIKETAELMGQGVTNTKTDWTAARAWLRRELKGT